ncbi:acyl-CoA dehydrogenase family protein [Bradyrhizobium genosp. P]|uniref:acyl-CoA dehydrogenase family protein n=1 Tax=Bradyrhizobium genosp. P TaxID=83641 RepID=UPI003CEFD52F
MLEYHLPTEEDRRLLRDSVRNFLLSHWPEQGAVQRGMEPDQIRKISDQLAAQGLAELGNDPRQGGLSEILIVQEELGRAACPAPMLAASLANILFDRYKVGNQLVVNLLEELHSGRALTAIAFGPLDGDRTACAYTFKDGRVSGEVRYLDVAHCATHFILTTSADSVAIVEAKAAGVSAIPTRVLGGEGLATVTFDRVLPLTTLQVDPSSLVDLCRVARLALSARAFGAADRAFELVVAYAKERKQFGRPIGKFQAIQHKLANCRISLLGVGLAIKNAGQNYDKGVAAWRVFAAAACAAASPALRQAALETHHAFGAIGYAEDHEAPRHFKRVHQDVLRHGGVRRAREELAAFILDEGNSLPEYDLGPEANEFREEVRSWLKSHWTSERQEEMRGRPNAHREYHAEFARDLGKTGWIGLNWPKEHGGQERSPLENLAFVEELARHEAPRVGAPIQATSWMLFGTDEQKKKYLPEILCGDAIYGMWYSEPNSGSDLASMRTRAVKDGDEWVINGQKIWTTSYWGDYMWLAAKTDTEANPPHAGISMFCIPTGIKGVTIRPVKTMYDGEFINTFLDDVRVPAECMVGKLNGGWEVLTGSLGTERGIVGANLIAKLMRSFEIACDYIRNTQSTGGPLSKDQTVRDMIGSFAAQIELGRQLALHCAIMAGNGETPHDLGAIAKVHAGETTERFYEAIQETLGTEAALSKDSHGAILRGRLDQQLRHSLMWVISIGTNEIQRNLIATHGLGLPR